MMNLCTRGPVIAVYVYIRTDGIVYDAKGDPLNEHRLGYQANMHRMAWLLCSTHLLLPYLCDCF